MSEASKISKVNKIGNASDEPANDSKDTIRQKLTDLSELVTWFQSPAFSLEMAVEKFQQAEKLAKEIETDLTKLKNEIKIIKKKFDD